MTQMEFEPVTRPMTSRSFSTKDPKGSSIKDHCSTTFSKSEWCKTKKSPKKSPKKCDIETIELEVAKACPGAKIAIMSGPEQTFMPEQTFAM